MSDNNKPFSILENSILNFKNFIEQELLKKESLVDAVFLKNLEEETKNLLANCKDLDNDAEFVQKTNHWYDFSKTKGFYKTERIFLSEIVSNYLSNKNLETPKSKFVLAYYYDVLRNNHFAEENSLAQLNQLVQSKEFSDLTEKILAENILNPINSEVKNPLFSVISLEKNEKLPALIHHFKNFQKFCEFPESEPEISDTLELPEKQSENEPTPENKNVVQSPENDTLEKALADLHNLVGIEKVKQDIHELINLLEIQKKRESEGLKNVEIALHTVFLGPPGTGKTSVARLLSRIFRQLGYLSKGQLFETDREGLVAGYVGQTAIKVGKAVDESLGGVLFIDEAYALTQNLNSNDFGSEAVNTIIKRMEDNRDDLAVVVAGYTLPMKQFIDSNPGLRSRFNRYFYFEHFTTEQLFTIFKNFCTNSDFSVSEDAEVKLKNIFSQLENYKTESFGNARVVRNIFEKAIQNQANRLIHWTAPKDEFLKILHAEDIPDYTQIIENLVLPPTETEES